MLKIKEIPYDDVREILASEELRVLNEALCNRFGLPMAPESNLTVALQSIMRNVCYTGLSKNEFCRLMASELPLIVELAAALSKKKDLGEEYPVGEEPDEEPDKGVVLGLSSCAGVGYATMLHFVRDRQKPDLMSYLEMSRTPHRAKFAKQLRNAFQETLATTRTIDLADRTEAQGSK